MVEERYQGDAVHDSALRKPLLGKVSPGKHSLSGKSKQSEDYEPFRSMKHYPGGLCALWDHLHPVQETDMA